MGQEEITISYYLDFDLEEYIYLLGDILDEMDKYKEMKEPSDTPEYREYEYADIALNSYLDEEIDYLDMMFDLYNESPMILRKWFRRYIRQRVVLGDVRPPEQDKYDVIISRHFKEDIHLDIYIDPSLPDEWLEKAIYKVGEKYGVVEDIKIIREYKVINIKIQMP